MSSPSDVARDLHIDSSSGNLTATILLVSLVAYIGVSKKNSSTFPFKRPFDGNLYFKVLSSDYLALWSSDTDIA